MDASVDTPSATTEATTKEEDEVGDSRMNAAPVRCGATGLARTTGRNSLARVPGGSSLGRTVLRPKLASLRTAEEER